MMLYYVKQVKVEIDFHTNFSRYSNIQIGSLNIGFCSAYLMRVFMFCSLKFSDFTLSIVCHVHHPYLYSSMEISDQSGMSAESVAILLLKKFSEKQLPKASELEWLVPISEAPQEVREKKR